MSFKKLSRRDGSLVFHKKKKDGSEGFGSFKKKENSPELRGKFEKKDFFSSSPSLIISDSTGNCDESQNVNNLNDDNGLQVIQLHRNFSDNFVKKKVDRTQSEENEMTSIYQTKQTKTARKLKDIVQNSENSAPQLTADNSNEKNGSFPVNSSNDNGEVYKIDLLKLRKEETMSQESPPPDHVMDVSDDVIEALNNMTVSGQTEVCSETSSQSGSSSARDAEINNLWVQDDRPDNLQQVENDETDKEKKKKMFKNPIKLLKKLSQVELAPPLHVPEPDLDAVTIDSLPQHFVTKYLGKRRCNGLQGVEHIRGPIDRMVREVTGNAAAEELPLVQVTVWPKGLQANLHPKTKSRDFEPFYLPIDFISFCAEHGSYQKIVGIINVTQMGPKITKTECQAFICHSALEARKLTVSMATAFKLYAERINGSQVKFQVDLRGKDQKGRRHSRNREFEA